MKQILFFGDSLTAGYGLADPEREALPALLQEKIDQYDLDSKIINAGESGDTSASALLRIDAMLIRHIDVFVLELGANDMIRGVPAETTFSNLQQIIYKVKQVYPEVKLLLLGMELPESVQGWQAPAFAKVYRDLAGDNHMAFVPFLLDGVAGVKQLNMYDGLHPLAAGYRIIADRVWPLLKDLIDPPAIEVHNDVA